MNSDDLSTVTKIILTICFSATVVYAFELVRGWWDKRKEKKR